MPFYSASLIETVQVSYFLLSLLFFGIFNIVCISDCVTEQFKQCPFKFFISQMPQIYSGLYIRDIADEFIALANLLNTF